MFAFIYPAVLVRVVLTINYLVDDLPYLEDQECDQCERVYAPVCGTDNRTYVNICKMQCYSRYAPPDMRPKIYMYGPCVISGRRTDVIGYNETFLMNKTDSAQKIVDKNVTINLTPKYSSEEIMRRVKRGVRYVRESKDFEDY